MLSELGPPICGKSFCCRRRPWLLSFLFTNYIFLFIVLVITVIIITIIIVIVIVIIIIIMIIIIEDHYLLIKIKEGGRGGERGEGGGIYLDFVVLELLMYGKWSWCFSRD